MPSPTTAPFRYAFERYERPLLQYAMRFVRDRERARDVVQDTFLRLCESDVDAADPRLASWLFTVCRNRAIDVSRREARLAPMESAPEVPVEPSGEHAFAVSEIFAQASTLPERKARVLELRYREGRSYQQIASETGMTESHVGVVLHDCIRFLRKNLSVVAGGVILLGAGAWGILGSRAEAPEPSFLTREEPSLPLVEHGKLAPELFYGPEEFHGPKPPPPPGPSKGVARPGPWASPPAKPPWAPYPRAKPAHNAEAF